MDSLLPALLKPDFSILLDLITFLNFGVTAYLAACALTRVREIRLLVACVVWHYLVALVFFPLIAGGLFTWGWVNGVVGAIAIGTVTLLRQRNLLKREYLQFRFETELSLYATVFCGLCLLPHVLVTCRAILAPPLVWDSLTYHLYKAAQWIKSSSWVWDGAYGSYAFYDYFPPLGDAYWALAMLGSRSDTTLVIWSFSIFCQMYYGLYKLARSLSIAASLSALVATVACSLPAVAGFMHSYYVDNTHTTCVVLGIFFYHYAFSKKSMLGLGLTSLAIGCAVGIKITNLPYFLLPAVGVFVMRKQLHYRRLSIVGLLCAIPLSWQAFMFSTKGSPLYPAGIAPFGTSDYQTEFFQLSHFKIKYQFSYAWEFWSSLYGFIFSRNSAMENANFSGMFALICLTSAIALKHLAMRRERNLLLFYVPVLTSALICTMTFWTPSTAAYRWQWLEIMGRFFIPLPFLLLLLTAQIPHKLNLTVLVLYALWLFKVNFPHFYSTDWITFCTSAGLFAACIALAVCCWRMKYRRFFLVGTCVLALLAAHSLRPMFQMKYWSAMPFCYEGFSVQNSAYPKRVYRYLNGIAPSTIAVYSDLGHRHYPWYRYPVFGHKLKHDVIYVSPFEGPVDIRNWAEPNTINSELWLQRLKNAKADYLLIVNNPLLDLKWIDQHSDVFQKVIGHSRGMYNFYKIRYPDKLSTAH